MSLSTFEAFKHIGVDGLIELTDRDLCSLQGVLFHMLTDFDEVCSHYGIDYTLSGGTCLGAVRSNGFIPWDDDLDINMSRADYRKFTEVFDDALGERYWLHDCRRTSGYELAFPRMRLKGTTVRCRDDYDGKECGAYIDIFIVENSPTSKYARGIHGFGSMGLGFLYSCRRFAAHAEENLALAGDNEGLRATFRKKIGIGKLLSFLSVSSWTKVWDAWNALCGDEESGYVTIPVGRGHYFGEMQEREDFFPVSIGSFCAMDVPLPANPEAYLFGLYGPDYMIPPAENMREKHVLLEFDLGSYSDLQTPGNDVEKENCK